MKLLSRVRLLATPWTAAYQAPPSMGFSRQEYWSGLPLPSPQLSLNKLSFCNHCLCLPPIVFCLSHLLTYFANKGLSSQSYGFSIVVRYGCESWTIKKAECQRIDVFELWCWKRLLRVPWTARRSNQLVLKEISSEYSLEELMLKLRLQYFGH